MSCLIVGAGLAGLMAGRTLQAQGMTVTILDEGAVAGGRLASHRWDVTGEPAIFDYGAQFFTARSPRFAALVEEWRAAGVVELWSHGFAAPDGSPYRDGYPRYRGRQGMVEIARHLARGLDIRQQTQVTAVAPRSRPRPGWLARTAGGQVYQAEQLILTPPVPQSLALLDAGGASLPAATRALLDAIDYDPCLALLLRLDAPSQIPAPGGWWPPGEIIAWAADNQAKGISLLPGVTLHASGDFSRRHFDAASERIVERMLAEAGPWLGAAALDVQLFRWRYSLPRLTYPEACLLVAGPPPLVLAGDAFAGPRVEGAVLSGLAAAAQLRQPPAT